MLIDSHTHLDSTDFDTDRDAVLERARAAGVTRILAVCSGTGSAELERSLRLFEGYPDLDVAVGIHPHEAKSIAPEDFDFLKQVAERPKVVAWGEIGLDYHYDHSPREVQRDIFIRQLMLASQKELPVIIHSRNAEAETLEILKQYWGHCSLGGILHCFTGSLKMAEECLPLGFMVSFSGMLTFPRAQELREVAGKIPLDGLLIETDAPYLAPVPNRGKRNEPAFLVETAKTLAGLRGLTLETLGEITAQNYQRLLKVP